MQPDKNPKPAARDKGARSESDGNGARTPSTDMQPEDAGTPDSGHTGTDRGSAAESVMKQTSKTPHERGDR